MFKKYFFIVIGLIVWLNFSLLVAAEEGSPLDAMDATTEDGLSIAKCISKGGFDFSLFLQSIVGSDGFVGNYLVPFEDVLLTNQCHSADILGLVQQQIKTRALIRDAYLKCEYEKVPNLKKAYYKLSAELFYVRNVIRKNIVVNLPYDLLSTRMLENKAELLTPRDEIYQEMREKFVDKGSLENDEFDVWFLILEKKYEKRVDDYIVCDNSSWEVVAEKWEEFISTAGGIAPAWNNLEKGVSAKAKDLADSASEFSMKNTLDGFFEIKVNGVDPETGFKEIFDSAAQDIKALGQAISPSPTEVLRSIDREKYRYSTDVLRTSMESQFEFLYKEGTDATIASFLSVLQNLNEILTRSSGIISDLENCTDDINGRQCAK